MAAMENVNKLPIPSSDPRIRALLESPETIAPNEDKKISPSGCGQVGGAGVTSVTRAERGAMAEGTNNQTTLKENLNANINTSGSVACSVRKGAMSDVETAYLESSTMKCLQSNDIESFSKLSDNITKIIESGLPSDGGSLNDIMTAVLILQIKSAMEGKKINREMSAEMASTIYQKSQEIASKILEKGELAYKQAMVGAVMGLVGTAISSTTTIVQSVRANQKSDKLMGEISSNATDSTRGFLHDDITRNTMIQKGQAIGGLGQAITNTVNSIYGAGNAFDQAKLQSEITNLEANNKLSETAMQSSRDAAEANNAVIRNSQQVMKECNNLVHEMQKKSSQ